MKDYTMTPNELDTLALKGMTAPRTASERPAPAQHSPLPWSYSAIGGDNLIMAKIGNSRVTVAEAIYDEANGEGISMEELDANKALIVRAVNNADKLAGALRNALNMIDPFVWDKSKEAAILDAYEKESQ